MYVLNVFLCAIGEIRSNRKMKKLNSKGVGVFILGFFLYPLYDIYYLIVVNMSIEINKKY